MNFILCVSNSGYVGQSFIGRYRDNANIQIALSKKGDPPEGEECFAEWKVDENGKETNVYIPMSELKGDYIIVNIRYEALVYILARERAKQLTKDIFCILTMKEPIPTKLVSLELYNYFFRGTYSFGFRNLIDFFERNHINELLSDAYDIVYKDAKDRIMPLLSDHIVQWLPKE